MTDKPMHKSHCSCFYRVGEQDDEIVRLRTLLADALPYLDDVRDMGSSYGEGWKSDELQTLVRSIEQLGSVNS